MYRARDLDFMSVYPSCSVLGVEGWAPSWATYLWILRCSGSQTELNHLRIRLEKIDLALWRVETEVRPGMWFAEFHSLTVNWHLCW